MIKIINERQDSNQALLTLIKHLHPLRGTRRLTSMENRQNALHPPQDTAGQRVLKATHLGCQNDRCTHLRHPYFSPMLAGTGIQRQARHSLVGADQHLAQFA
jgi:hypothetical protein